MTEQQRQTDNRLLEMIQRHFPSLPLDDRYTDWQKWLGFARAAYEAGATDEREACANLCDANAKHWREMYTTANPRAAELVLRGYSAREYSAADCATNIRERSNAKVSGLSGFSRSSARLMGYADRYYEERKP